VWRIFLVNAAILVAACAVLLLSPVTVSSPVAVEEALVVVAGLSLMLVLTLVLLRHAFSPLERLAEQMSRVDLLHPGPRASEDGPDVEVNVLARSFNEMLDRLESERRASAGRAAAAQEDERRRVAQELHDHVGQVLTGVLLQAEQATRVPADELGARLRELRDAAREALEDVRRIARELRPEALDDLGLPSALNALAVTISRQSGLEIERRFDRDLPHLSPEAELLVYRVAQESLTNVVRHAGASRIELVLRRTASAVVLTVQDDGCGLPAELPRLSGGLRGMRERALAGGAILTLAAGPLRGTIVHLEVPDDA
jgi:two-component system, NarL family, sensor histidine kinase UhpB